MPSPRDEDAPVTNPEAEERVQFMLRLRARGIDDLRLLRALERAPRALFMPQRYGDIAARDIALPIGCGQTAPPPSIVAAMIRGARSGRREAGCWRSEPGPATPRRCSRNWRGKSFRSSAARRSRSRPRARLEAFGLANVRVDWADGLALDPEGGLYDRILVHALIEAPAPRLTDLLVEGGSLVAAVADDASGEQRIVRLTRAASGEIVASAHGAARDLQALGRGPLARAVRRRAEPRRRAPTHSHTKDSS